MSVLTTIRMSQAQTASPASLAASAAWACGAIKTDIPARLDSLPWGGFHTRVIAALGITWILDGLEVTLAGALSGALKDSPVLKFSNTDIGLVTSAYIAGAVLGAIGFGWLTDRIGRKKLFFVTLAVYLTATAATAFSWNLASFALFRFLTGAGIGGEYTAINSTIQELVPARYRGRTDLIVNGSFWIGAAIGAVSAIVLLDPGIIDPELGWRLAFLIGAGLGLVGDSTRPRPAPIRNASRRPSSGSIMPGSSSTMALTAPMAAPIQKLPLTIRSVRPR